MPTVNSALSSLILCLALASSVVLSHGGLKKNASAPIKPETPGRTTTRPPEVEGSAILPIKSRILERPIYPKRAESPPSYPVNLTSSVVIKNDYNIDRGSSATTKLPGPLGNSSPSSKTMEFRPSVHIGEINEYESRKSTNNSPFNKVGHVKFDNTLIIDESVVDTDGVRVPTSSFRDREPVAGDPIAGTKKIPVKFFETDGRYDVTVPVEVTPQHQEYYEPNQVQLQLPVQQTHDDNTDNDDGKNDDNPYNSNNHETSMGHETLVTFEYPRSPGYVTVTSKPITLLRPLYPSSMSQHQSVGHHPYHQHYEVPAGNVHTFYIKPSKLHEDIVTAQPNPAQPEHNEYVVPESGEAIEKPDAYDFHRNNYQQAGHYQQVSPHESPINNIVKPETLLYVTSHRESAFTRMRKFPYKFYEPSVHGHQDNEYHYSIQEIPHSFPSKERRGSPWKKIIHLIGAFLPLGLLLATLKPNVVKIENTTQPNIVLSKLRVVDLPAEHKRGRLTDKHEDEYQNDTCDDRSICELIVSGSEPSSNLLQNILWNLTNRSTDEEAQKHGLHEIFAAAKRKDCLSIDC